MISNIQSKRTESDYFKSLPETEKTPYKAKLTLSDGFALPDPFAIEEWSDNTSKIPEVTYPDIYSYLIDTPSEFTKEKMKCYKSLEACNFFICGHVQDIYSHEFISNKEFTAVKSKVARFLLLSLITLITSRESHYFLSHSVIFKDHSCL